MACPDKGGRGGGVESALFFHMVDLRIDFAVLPLLPLPLAMKVTAYRDWLRWDQFVLSLPIAC